jgi:hypothetical protein
MPIHWYFFIRSSYVCGKIIKMPSALCRTSALVYKRESVARQDKVMYPQPESVEEETSPDYWQCAASRNARNWCRFEPSPRRIVSGLCSLHFMPRCVSGLVACISMDSLLALRLAFGSLPAGLQNVSTLHNICVNNGPPTSTGFGVAPAETCWLIFENTGC